MVIVVTDEVGDDDKEYLEPAIEAASSAKVPVYVLGSQAIFGRAEGFMDYTDPKTGKTFRNVPVRQGPRAPCSSRSACRSGTAASSTT